MSLMSTIAAIIAQCVVPVMIDDTVTSIEERVKKAEKQLHSLASFKIGLLPLLRELRFRDRRPRFGLVGKRKEIDHEKAVNDELDEIYSGIARGRSSHWRGS